MTENKRVVAAAEKTAPKVLRTIVLPGGYRSEEDFNPGAYIPVRSLERDRFVAWNRMFGEASAPFKFDRALTPELLPQERRAEYERLESEVRRIEEGASTAVSVPARRR